MKTLTAIFAALLLVLSFAAEAFCAGIPYDSYNYDYRGNVVFTPPAYVPVRGVSGADLGIGEFVSPQDICVTEDGVFIADAGANRVIKLDTNLTKVLAVIDGFNDENGGQKLISPYGVTVDAGGDVYIADTDNRRIVVLDGEDFSFVRYIENPVSDVLPQDFVFTPLKVEVDYAGRVYAIAKGMFQGIMQFNSDGEFIGFYGTINVKISPWQKFWQRFFSKEQRQSGLLFIPTEFTGISLDDKGFLYASNIDAEGVQAVRRLNPSGVDVLQTGTVGVGGDFKFGISNDYDGPSIIVDVAYKSKGIYSLLDSKRGRIFTYDREGDLLYVFGGKGSQTGAFRSPAAIAWNADGTLLAVDSLRKEIMVFGETAFGKLINDAVSLRFDGLGAEAVAKWKEVLVYDESFELANIGVGKAYLSAGDSEQALKYLKLGMNREYYSVALKRYRGEWLKANAVFMLIGIAAVLAVIIAFAVKGKRRVTSNGKLSYLLRTMTHPADTYYEIRHRGAGSVPLALITVALFSVSFTLNRLYAGFVVNDVNPLAVDILRELSGVFVLFGLFCAGNWAVTCLMNGEGRFKDIVIAVGYALLPMAIAFSVGTVVSRVIVSGEETYYLLILGIGLIWAAALVTTGIMTVHNYSLAKTLATLVLTALAMLAIMFLGLLLISLITQAWDFVVNVYTDLAYRR
ncbi:hypothetical protein FACS189490_07640 [Clostridia bacterium]|nr:hypothetical protein FACS189490_07640 [Clostridia bacterium]